MASRSVPLERLDAERGFDVGLTTAEVAERTARFGRNEILETVGGGWWPLVRETIKDPMLWFLLGTSALFAFVGDTTEAVILLIALVPFLGMDAYLHRRTHASIEGLSSRLATQALVERDGSRQPVASTELVPGDLVVVSPGEPFPADGLLVRGARLQSDESALTGEAFPVRKEPMTRLPHHEAGEAKVDGMHWGYAGTRLLTGEARLRIVYTGGETLYGQIVRSATRGVHARTPLQSAVANLVAVLVVIATLICVALAWVRYRQGHGLLDALLSAVTLAVAALPEEFPVVLTFFLGVGVYRLAKRQALVRRAVVVENIGRVSCICSDKTGTITEGRLLLAHGLPSEGTSPERLLTLAAAASRQETGDPMDIAILEALGRPLPWEAVASFPFTEDRRCETGVLRENGRLLAAAKGAPEVILGRCAIAAAERERWQVEIDTLAAGAHKVIACAWRELDPDWPGGEPDRGFHMAGLLAFEDPIRSGVPEAMRNCRTAGIRVVMVTGDHPATAHAVASELGLGGGSPRVIEGDEMEARLARGEKAVLGHVDVIARAVPAQKLALVRTLQAGGEIVAVTGDGVNDVPALQAADVGIAMGERGTRTAREVAAIVLLDDNFSSIVRAIAEGRQLYTNLQLSFQYLLMIHLPLVVTAALIPLAGYPLLYLPVHIVWLELIIHPTALLVFQELPGDQRLARVKRLKKLRFFSAAQWFTIALVGTAVTAVVTFSYLRSLGAGHDVEHARAMALVALTVASAGITANLSRLRSRAAQVMVAGTVALSLLLVQTPAIASALHVKPLHVDDWALAIAGGLLASLLSAITSVRSVHAGR
jgi:Ca2+-transporting ATPase